MVFFAMRAGSIDLGLGVPIARLLLASFQLPFYNVVKYNARLLGFGPGGTIARNTQHTVEKSELRSPEKV